MRWLTVGHTRPATLADGHYGSFDKGGDTPINFEELVASRGHSVLETIKVPAPSAQPDSSAPTDDDDVDMETRGYPASVKLQAVKVEAEDEDMPLDECSDTGIHHVYVRADLEVTGGRAPDHTLAQIELPGTKANKMRVEFMLDHKTNKLQACLYIPNPNTSTFDTLHREYTLPSGFTTRGITFYVRLSMPEGSVEDVTVIAWRSGGGKRV